VGTVFFLLLILAALTPSLACFEPTVAWMIARGVHRSRAAVTMAALMWLAGVGSILSFNVLSNWHPLKQVPVVAEKGVFELVDFISGNVLLPVGALLTCLFIGWRLDEKMFAAEIGSRVFVWKACRVLLRYVCPIAIFAVLVVAFLPGH
jgi:NSS family neurotransmitter:Na+ symporter